MTFEEATATAKRLIDTYPEIMDELLAAGASPMEALLAVVRHEQKILKEILDGETDRAKAIRNQIFEQTWSALKGGSQ